MSESPVARACRRWLADYDSVAARVCAEFCQHCNGMEKYPACVRPPDGDWADYDEPCALCLLAEQLGKQSDLLCGEGGALNLLLRRPHWDKATAAERIAWDADAEAFLHTRAAEELGATPTEEGGG